MSYFCWEPTVLRAGQRARKVVRTADRWQSAFAGHKQDAHGGKRDPHCRACREMEAKLNQAKDVAG